MDLKLTNYDLDLTNGELSFVTDFDAIRQDIEMALRTWLRETPYDRNAGVPYLQIIFKRGTSLDAIRFIISEIIQGREGVTEVLELATELDTLTRTLTITGRVLASGQVIDFAAGSPTPPGPWVPPANGLQSWLDLERRRYTLDVGIASMVDEGAIGGTLDQAAPTKQPPVLQTLGLNNLQNMAPDGVDDFLLHSAAASSWQFLNNALGATVAVVTTDPADADGALFATMDGAASTDVGIRLRRVAGNLELRVANGGGAFALDLTAAVAASADKIIAIRLDATGVQTQINGAVVAGLTAAYAAAPADVAPDYPLTLLSAAGAAPAGGGLWGPGWFAAYDRYNSDAETAELFAQLNTRYRIYP